MDFLPLPLSCCLEHIFDGELSWALRQGQYAFVIMSNKVEEAWLSGQPHRTLL